MHISEISYLVVTRGIPSVQCNNKFEIGISNEIFVTHHVRDKQFIFFT